MQLALSQPTRLGLVKPGPEACLQFALESELSNLFRYDHEYVWSGGPITIGAGQPDLIVTSYKPELASLNRISLTAPNLLGYMRTVKYVTLEKLSLRLGVDRKSLEPALEELIESCIVSQSGNCFALEESWRDIFEDVIAIEVKVSNWRKAVCQAVRNTIVGHRSYVAVPPKVAVRVCEDEMVRLQGIGVISIGDEEIKIVRRARKTQPKVWSYYYKLAFLAAKNID